MALDLVIWDWDGTAADTEPCWSKADKLWLSWNGVDYNDEVKSQLTGRGQKDCVNALMAFGEFTIPTEEAIRQRLTALQEIYATIKDDILMPGVRKLIQAIYDVGICQAIASGSAQSTLDMIVNNQRLYGFMDLVISTDKVPQGKPAPDIYLEVARSFGIPTQNCLAIEDAYSGVVSAKDAGIYCISVPNKYTKNQDFSRADLVIGSLEELTVQRLIESHARANYSF